MRNIVRATQAMAGVSVLVVPMAALAASGGTSSEGITLNKKPFGNVQRQAQSVRIDAPDSVKKAPNVDSTKPVAQPASSDFALYDGKTVSAVSVSGSAIIDGKTITDALGLKAGNKLTMDAVRADMQKIYNIGYFYDVRPAFRVMKGKTPEQDRVEVMYLVTENPVIKDIDISGTSLINKFNLAKSLGIGNTAPNMSDIGKRLSQVNEELKKNGYMAAGITGMSLSPDGVLHIAVSDGKIERYELIGNKRTRDNVILRELRQKPGEPFNSILAQRGAQRLRNTGLFDDVDMRLSPGKEPGTVVVTVEVEEANTATIGVGVNYSASDGAGGQVSFTENNLFGTGDSLSAKWEFGSKDNANYDVSYVKRWLDKKETSMSISLYKQTHEFADYDRKGHEIARYDKRYTGQEITFSRAEGEFVRNSVTLKHRTDTYVKPEGGYDTQYFEEGYTGETYGKTAAERRKEDFGETRSISLTRTYDNRDNVFDPHHGKRNSYTFELAGFGGDFNYRKLSADYRYYWEMGKPREDRMNHVLALNVAAGYAWGNMPLSQRFSVGGSHTLRGYRDDQFRGNSMLRGSLEYRIPIAKKVQALAFIDAGYAWDKRDERSFDLDKIKTGYGVGIRFQSPIGPIRLDYGIGEQKRFHFSFGGSF